MGWPVSVTYHKYLGRDEVPPAETKPRGNGQSAKEKLDAEWRRKRIVAEDARQRLHEAKLLAMKGELISKRHVQKQAHSWCFRCGRACWRLPSNMRMNCWGISDRREMTFRLDAIVRDALETSADLPLKVTDEHWLEKLDDVGQPAKRRIAK